MNAVGITKEMWTVVLRDNGAWIATDIFADTEAQAMSTLELQRNSVHGITPSGCNTKGAAVTRCIVSIYPPYDLTLPSAHEEK